MFTRNGFPNGRGSELLSLGKAVLPDEGASGHAAARPRGRFMGSERSSLPRLAFAFGVAGLFFMALPLLAKSPKITLTMAKIENTGSTNTLGYAILVQSDGRTWNTVVHLSPAYLSPADTNIAALKADNVPVLRATVGHLSPVITRKFFHDLAAAMPLTSLMVRHGMRSASFGTRTYITYKGQRSPDLTFGGDAPANALKADIDAITKALHVGNAPRRLAMKRPPSPQ